MLRFNKLIFRFGSEKIPPKPQNPNMYESFATKIPKAQLEKFMNPMGFLKDEELSQYETTQPQQDGKESQKLDKNGMPPECGFKVKGLEPTRYGDWERKGRVTDF